jgi:hypothetical protein
VFVGNFILLGNYNSDFQTNNVIEFFAWLDSCVGDHEFETSCSYKNKNNNNIFLGEEEKFYVHTGSVNANFTLECKGNVNYVRKINIPGGSNV